MKIREISKKAICQNCSSKVLSHLNNSYQDEMFTGFPELCVSICGTSIFQVQADRPPHHLST